MFLFFPFSCLTSYILSLGTGSKILDLWKARKQGHREVELLKCHTFILRGHSSLERFLATKALFYWGKVGGGKEETEKYDSRNHIAGMPKGGSDKWVIVHQLLLVIKHEFPISIWPTVYRRPVGTWFPFRQQSLTWKNKTQCMSQRKMKSHCKRLRRTLANVQRCIFVLCFPKIPGSAPFPTSLESHWTVSTAAQCQRNKPWSVTFRPFPPFCLHKGDRDYPVPISL